MARRRSTTRWSPRTSTTTSCSLVIGPWAPFGRQLSGDRTRPATSYPATPALEFRTRYMKPFLDHYLKGTPDPKTPPVLTYATGDQQVGRVESTGRWARPTPLYLQANGALGWTKPSRRGRA